MTQTEITEYVIRSELKRIKAGFDLISDEAKVVYNNAEVLDIIKIKCQINPNGGLELVSAEIVEFSQLFKGALGLDQNY